jgi:hypothetical protein
MRCTLSQQQLQIILEEASAVGRRLSWQMRLPNDGLADIRQELLVDLFARLPAFDPRRGSVGAFAGVVMAHCATRIAKKVKRERLLYGAVPVSLNETLPDSDGATRGDITSENDGLAAYFGQQVDGYADVERRIDVERGLATLSREEAALCAALSRTSVDRLATTTYGARASLYRRVKGLRLALTAAGVEAA